MIELPFPTKILWPNGRTRSFMAKHRMLKKHREWARLATLADKTRPAIGEGRVQLTITVYPKTRNRIDADAPISACKAYIDGIADALGIDDSRFNLPRLQFGEPVKGGKIVIAVDHA